MTMPHRIAKKIVKKLLDNPYKATGYTRDQIDKAFRRMKTEDKVVEDALAGWHHAKAEERKNRQYAPAAMMVAAQIAAEENDRILAKINAEGLPPGSITMGMTPGPDPREAALPDIYEGKTMPELRELAKDQGKTGYSKLAKADLIKLLIGKD